MGQAFTFTKTAGAETGRMMRIGEVARVTGVGVETLRFYEKSGLIDRPARSYSGYRSYDSSVLERLDFIKKAQLLGFTLDEIRQLILHKRAGENPCAEVREVVSKRLAALDEKIAAMNVYRAELAEALAQWEKKGESAGHVCGLIESSEIHHGMRREKIGDK